MIGDWNRKEKPLLGLQGSGGGLGYLAGRVADVADLLYTISNSGVSFTLRSGGTVNYTVDWGDGSDEETSTSNTLSHTYSSAGDYSIKITPAEGSVYQPFFNNVVSDAQQITSIEKNTGSFPALVKAFHGASNMTNYSQVSSASSTVTNFERTWSSCSSLTSFPLIDTSSGTSFYLTWRANYALTSFPLIDTSSGTSFRQAWESCRGLTSFPLIDTSSGTNFQRTWFDCVALTSFPLINTSSGTNFKQTWSKCSALTSFPLVDTSSGTNFNQTWINCSGLTTFPLLDVSNGTDFNNAWRSCSGITTFPSLDFSSGTTFDAAWRDCSSLTTYPADQFDTTGTLASTAFNNSWNNCALTAQSIENILTSLDTNGAQNITLVISGGSNAAKTTWSTAANTAYTNLINKGWTISYNS